MTITRQALVDRPRLSTEHAAVIAGTTSRLPETLDRHRTGQGRRPRLVAQAARVNLAWPWRRSARRALLPSERTAVWKALTTKTPSCAVAENRARVAGLALTIDPATGRRRTGSRAAHGTGPA